MPNLHDDFHGYSLTDINDSAQDIFHALVDLNIPIKLGVLALCKCITMIGDSEDLDMACRVIDELDELPSNEELDPEIEWESDETNLDEDEVDDEGGDF